MISGALVVAPAIVAAAFLMSGLSKIRTHHESIRAMRELKVPLPALHQTAARVLPWAEIALGAMLLALPGIGFRVAAWLTVAVLLIFTFLLIAALLRHDEVDCNCFGSLAANNSRVTGWTVARNAALIVLAATAALFVPNGAIVQVFQLSGTELGWFFLVLSNAAALLVIAGFASRRRSADAAEATVSLAKQSDSDAAEVTPIPDTEFVSATGEIVPFKKLWQGRATVVIFIKTDCTPCAEITANLEGWRRELEQSMDIRVVTSTGQAKFRQAYPELADDALYGSLSTRKALGFEGHPAAILLGTDASIIGPALGSEEVIDLLTAIVTAANAQTNAIS